MDLGVDEPAIFFNKNVGLLSGPTTLICNLLYLSLLHIEGHPIPSFQQIYH